jgi:hypothetical protein
MAMKEFPVADHGSSCWRAAMYGSQLILHACSLDEGLPSKGWQLLAINFQVVIARTQGAPQRSCNLQNWSWACRRKSTRLSCCFSFWQILGREGRRAGPTGTQT